MAVKKTVVPDPVVTLNDDYQVTIDRRCYILQRKSNSDDKDISKEEQKAGYVNLGYYTTWDSLGTSLVKEITREKAKVKKEDKLMINDFINIVKETNKEVIKMFENVDKQAKIKKESK